MRPREMRAEGRRRLKKAKKAMEAQVSINKNACCCCVVLEVAIHRPQFQSARPPLSTTPYSSTPRESGFRADAPFRLRLGVGLVDYCHQDI